MKSIKTLLFLILALLFVQCKDDPDPDGNLRVIFEANEYFINGNNTSIEGMRFGIFPTEFNESFAFDRDAIQVVTIENRVCTFQNILAGTYKIAFMQDPQVSKIIQVFPDKGTDTTFE